MFGIFHNELLKIKKYPQGNVLIIWYSSGLSGSLLVGNGDTLGQEAMTSVLCLARTRARAECFILALCAQWYTAKVAYKSGIP